MVCMQHVQQSVSGKGGFIGQPGGKRPPQALTKMYESHYNRRSGPVPLQLDPSNAKWEETLHLQVATQNVRRTSQAREAGLQAGNLTCVFYSVAAAIRRCECVDKTSWVMGSRKLVLGLRKKRSVSSFEQADKQTLLKHLLFIRSIATNQGNSLLIHFMHKKTKKKQFFQDQRLP